MVIRKKVRIVLSITVYLFFCLGLIQPGLLAEEVTIDTARQVAVNVLNEHRARMLQKRDVVINPSNVSEEFSVTENNITLYHVFNINPDGWAVISADNAAAPVIAYSPTGSFTIENQPPAMAWWMNEIKFKLSKAIENRILPTMEVNEKWEKMSLPSDLFYLENCFSETAEKKADQPVTESVSALISTTWGQSGVLGINAWPFVYNKDCPCTNWFLGGCTKRVLTGCVATAMGQIIRYHAWPPHGWGTHSYDHPDYGTQTVNYSAATYDYSNMANVSGHLFVYLHPEIPKLLRHCGVSVNMDYGPDSSGAYSSDVPEALSSHFGYQGATYQAKEEETWNGSGWTTTVIDDADWIDILKAELDAGRPVFYAGTDANGEGGHAFVCDGYDSSNNLHMNWGWDGFFNGYYTLDLNITLLWFIPIDEFSTNHRIIKNIRPNQAPVVDAGPDRTFFTYNQNSGVLQGTMSDPDKTGQTLTYSWLYFTDPLNPLTLTILKDSTSTTNGNASLHLNSVPDFPIGSYTLYLSVSDGVTTSADSMTLTIENAPPSAYAGPNMTIDSEQQQSTVLNGTISDPDTPFNELQYRWVEDSTVLQEWQAGSSSNVTLDLNTLPDFSIGIHTLTLEVTDGIDTRSDNMLLTIENSAPNVGPQGAGVYEIWNDVCLSGQVSDYDGDELTVTWTEGTTVLDTQTVSTIYGGTPVAVTEFCFNSLYLGTHILTMTADDGINTTYMDITVEIVDTTVPTLAPVSDRTIIWPPNHKMMDIAINAHAEDNSGDPVILSAAVFSNEPEDNLGDGDTEFDWTAPFIDQENGMIYLSLRAERSGSGDSRIYTITVRATDSSGNFSEADVNVVVPHDVIKEKPVKKHVKKD